jgi:D-glycero-D-manno-heptose 1,7-bisphosphate phosphatase
MQAVFLDRDGVINEERPDYVKSWDEFVFLPGVLSALHSLAKLAVPILVISNQSAIGRGLVTQEAVDQIHRRVQLVAQRVGGKIDNFFVCPHHPEIDCDCRKPKPGLLDLAASIYQLDLARCVFIGDSITDFYAAQAAGCQSILVKSGRQRRQLLRFVCSNPSVRLVNDLAAAVELIDKK